MELAFTGTNVTNTLGHHRGQCARAGQRRRCGRGFLGRPLSGPDYKVSRRIKS